MHASSRSGAVTRDWWGGVRRALGVASLGTATTVLSVAATGCASARTSFTPYSTTSARSPVVMRAVEASERDLPALAGAGAVLVGTVTSRGNGFAGAQHVRDALAQEAARHGGTHVVVGMTLEKSARGQRLHGSGSATPQRVAGATYHPGRTIELTAVVLRLPDDTSWVALPPALRPERDALVVRDAATVTRAPAPTAQAAEPPPAARVAHIGPQSTPQTERGAAAAESFVIDGSHIKPLPGSKSE